MIQHARTFSTPFPLPADLDEDAYALDDPIEEEAFEAEFDDTLDHLLKHAMKRAATEPDTEQMWQQLSRRMQGPFGYQALALEAPAFNSIEAELLTSGGTIQQAPFVLNDRVTERSKDHSREKRSALDCMGDMLRFGSAGRSLGSSVGILG